LPIVNLPGMRWRGELGQAVLGRFGGHSVLVAVSDVMILAVPVGAQV
jgi:hypothetical protein